MDLLYKYQVRHYHGHYIECVLQWWPMAARAVSVPNARIQATWRYSKVINGSGGVEIPRAAALRFEYAHISDFVQNAVLGFM